MIGYEGYIKVGGEWCLGTGGSVPETRARIDSSGAYGGESSGANNGIGYPHIYDWTNWDGSVDFEMTSGMLSTIKSWVIQRDSLKSIEISSRFNGFQKFSTAIWDSITISASEGAFCTGTLGFTAIEREDYVYGSNNVNNNPFGLITDAVTNLVAIPYWETSVEGLYFTDWNLEFSQEVVKFGACMKLSEVEAPIYYGVGPLSVSFSGSCILKGSLFDNDMKSLSVKIGDGGFNLGSIELQTQDDAMTSGNTMTPISITAEVYEVS